MVLETQGLGRASESLIRLHDDEVVHPVGRFLTKAHTLAIAAAG